MRQEVYSLLPASSKVGYWFGRLVWLIPLPFIAWSAVLAYVRGSEAFWVALGVGFAWVAARSTWRTSKVPAFTMRSRALHLVLGSKCVPMRVLAAAFDARDDPTCKVKIALVEGDPKLDVEVWVRAARVVHAAVGNHEQNCVQLDLTDQYLREDRGKLVLVPPVVAVPEGDDRTALFTLGLVYVGEPEGSKP